MKKFLGLLMLVTLLNFLFTALGYCWEIKGRHEYLIDVRGDDGDIILNRFSLHNKLKPPGLEITAFGEAQWNTLTSEWEKITLGGETGKYIWKWLYIGQSIQFISGEMLDYMVFNTVNNSVDSTTTVAFDLPLRKNLSLCLFEQYATNLEKGRGEYCETGIELSYNFKESYTLGFGWRHTDRIHNLDTDYVSSSFTLSF